MPFHTPRLRDRLPYHMRKERKTMKRYHLLPVVLLTILLCFPSPSLALSDVFTGSIYDLGQMKPTDSTLKVAVGDEAPDFELPSLAGDTIRLSSFRGKKNVVISFVPAAWTPVCSDQWPGYNIMEDIFTAHHTILLGITVDNLPTLYAWTQEMGDLWFRVLSDFWPHGAAADAFGVLRSDGMTERALFLIDTQGIIRYIHVGDINIRPPLDGLLETMKAITGN